LIASKIYVLLSGIESYRFLRNIVIHRERLVCTDRSSIFHAFQLVAIESLLDALADEMIINNTRHAMFEVKTSVYSVQMRLVIINLQKNDLGGYKCISKNSIGDAEGNIRLYGEFPRVTRRQERKQVVKSLYVCHSFQRLSEETLQKTQNDRRTVTLLHEERVVACIMHLFDILKELKLITTEQFRFERKGTRLISLVHMALSTSIEIHLKELTWKRQRNITASQTTSIPLEERWISSTKIESRMRSWYTKYILFSNVRERSAAFSRRKCKCF